MSLNLKVDPKRFDERNQYQESGIFVRAQHQNGTWDSVDFIFLTKRSLARWLRSRGGHNPWAEDVVGILLGHDLFAPEDFNTDSEE